MPFYSYKDRREDQQQKRLTTGAILAVGLAAFLGNSSARSWAGRTLVRSTAWAGSRIENLISRGTLRTIESSVSNRMPTTLSGSRLDSTLTSFKRLIESDIPVQQRRESAIEHLVTKGWSQSDASVMFAASNRSYDLLRSGETSHTLAHSFYKDYIASRLSVNRFADKVQVLSDISEAIGVSREIEELSNPFAYKQANKLFADAIKENFVSKRDPFGSFGIKSIRLGNLTHSKLFGNIEELLGDSALQLDSQLSPRGTERGFLETLNARMLEYSHQMTEADITAAKLSYSLQLAGHKDWQKTVRNISTDYIKADNNFYNVTPISNLVKSVGNAVSNNFIVPIAPGMGGLMPLKLFPWYRGSVKDFAGTLGAGTRQTEVFKGLARHTDLRNKLFDENQNLKADLHYINKKLFGSYVEEGTLAKKIVPLPEDLQWEIKDVRTGFGKAFARIRSNQDYSKAPSGKLRQWFGDSAVGRAMDFLGIDHMGEPSSLASSWSSIGKYLWPNSDKYSTHPINSLNRVLEGSNSIEDIESVLLGIRRHIEIPYDVDPRKIFTEDVLDIANLPKGFDKLIQGGFADKDVTVALKELDMAIAKEGSGVVPNFFSSDDRDIVRGLHTKINARRYSQDQLGFLVSGTKRNPDPSIINMKGLLGEPDPITGLNRIKSVLYEEIYSQISSHPEGAKAFRKIINNVRNIDHKNKDKFIAGIWSSWESSYLGESFLNQETRAVEIANDLRTHGNTLLPDILSTLKKQHGGLTPWITPNLDELEGVGARVIAVPYRKPLLQAVKDSIRTGTFDPIKESFTKDVGDSTYPGAYYHTGFRLNEMLSKYGLGLPDAWMQTGGQTLYNLTTKRVLPAIVGVEAWKYLNFESNALTGWSPSEGLTNLRARGTLALSKLGDITHWNNLGKRLTELIPGLSDYWQPRSKDEQKDYMLNGYEPVRSGRYWLAGSRSPWLGGKISYWSPTWYQLGTSNWQAADNVDLNSDFYWSKRSWLPTLRHPFAPITRLFHPYAWEDKHAEDRPYIQSGGMFAEDNILGILGNMTIGRILKPTRVYHPEFLGRNIEVPDGVFESGGGPHNLHVGFSPKGMDTVTGTLGGRGGMGGGGGTEVSLRGNALSYGDDDYIEGDILDPTSFAVQNKRMGDQWYDIAGIYGYGYKAYIAEKLGYRPEHPLYNVIQSPTRAYGYERRFYDRNLGGFPGDLSEFWRRVIPHRDKSLTEINPVPNNIGEKYPWLPGDDYFLNPRRGDPYLLGANGEYRLPGAAYEAVHRNKGYDPVTRVEILSDMFLYSPELQTALDDARQQVAEEPDPVKAKWLQSRINQAEHRASLQKKKYNIHNYRFNQDTDSKDYEVQRFIDANTILVKGSPNPIRLAGIRLSKQRIRKYLSDRGIRIDKEYMREHNINIRNGDPQIQAFYKMFGVVPGKNIKALTETEENRPISNDMLHTIHAAIYVGHTNVSRQLLRSGAAIEKKTDYSAPAMNVRFSGIERGVGNVFERISHLDTWLHTKLWHVRSSLEEYKRSQVYGTTAGDWAHPIKTYVRPTLDAMASKGLAVSTITGAFIGSLFVGTRGPKKIAALVGGAIGAQASIRRSIKEFVTGEKYIPERVQTRREVEEYYDTLKFIKYKRLERQYEELAKTEEGTDVQEIIRREDYKAENFKAELNKLEGLKREIVLSDSLISRRNKRLGGVNYKIQKLTERSEDEFDIGPYAARALLYRNLSERTLIGAKPGDSLNNAMGGIPKYERELVLDIVTNGTAKEKKEFFSLLSNRQKSALGYSLGIPKGKIPKKESLFEYFKDHQLPDDSWAGWNQDFSLDWGRIVTAKEEGVTPTEMDIYPRNEVEGDLATRDVPIPVIHGRSEDIKRTLETLLSGKGVRNINIDLSMAPSTDKSTSDIDIEIEQDRMNDVLRYT